MLSTKYNLFVLDTSLVQALYSRKTGLQCLYISNSGTFQFCFSLVNTTLARLFNETVRFCYELVCVVFPTV